MISDSQSAVEVVSFSGESGVVGVVGVVVMSVG